MQYKYRLYKPAPDVQLVLRFDRTNKWEYLTLETANAQAFRPPTLTWEPLASFPDTQAVKTIMDGLFSADSY